MAMSSRLPARLGTAASFAVATSVAAGLLTAPAAVAAPTVTTRVASFTTSASTVVRGTAVTYKGVAQKYSAGRWLAAPKTSVSVYFDADGKAANKLMGTVKTTSTGAFTARFTPSASGYWTVRFVQTGTYKTSLSVRKYVKVTSPTTYRPPAGSWNCPSWAPIKGNLSSHIYHLPGQRYYSRTKPEFCFATEAAARAAGFRKSKV